MAASNGVEKFGNFDLVTRAKLEYADILVSKWKSRTTGLSVVHLDYNGTPPMPRSVWFVGDVREDVDRDMQHPSLMGISSSAPRVCGDYCYS